MNYEEIAELKLRVLRAVFATFVDKHGKSGHRTERTKAFHAYREAEGVYLERYTTFCALQEHFQSGSAGSSNVA